MEEGKALWSISNQQRGLKQRNTGLSKWEGEASHKGCCGGLEPGDG